MLPASVINSLESIKLEPEALAVEMLSRPQAQCPVMHHFGKGVYIRSVSIKAGDYLVGHAHKTEHTIMVLKGRAVILGEQPKYIDASTNPVIFTSGTGSKVVAVLEDCEWLNIFPNPNDERDIEALENLYLTKSDLAQEFDRLYLEKLGRFYDADREDFKKALDELGLTEEEAQVISNRDELAKIPDEYLWRLSVRPSPIHGKGLFLSCDAGPGELIAPATNLGVRTIAGKYVNHSATPNCQYERIGGEAFLVSLRAIGGSDGGFAGEELTADYRQSVRLSRGEMQ